MNPPERATGAETPTLNGETDRATYRRTDVAIRQPNNALPLADGRGRDLPATPHPLAVTLPAVYQDDQFVHRLCDALDTVLAPVHTVLDTFPAYLDPTTTPDDMLTWLAAWLGLTPPPGEPPPRQRHLLHAAAELLRWQGTVHGLAATVEAVHGHPPDVTETGATAWSTAPNSPLPGTSPPRLHIAMAADSGVDTRRVEALVRAVIPVHLPCDITGPADET